MKSSPDKTSTGIRALAWCLIFAVLLTVPLQAASAEYSLSGRVDWVFDGDTVQFNSGGNKLRLRLYGIDAPERGQPMDLASRKYLESLVLSKNLTIRVLGRDRYQRYISKLALPDGRDAGEELVRAGLAWWYRQYAPQDTRLAKCETEARTARRGLWALPAAQPPWQYRAGHRK